MRLRSSFEQLSELAVKRDEVHFGFIKQILLMSSGLLGILVSLHKSSSTERITQISFAFALGLLALGILFLTIGLSAQVAVQRAQFVKWKNEVSALLNDENYELKIIMGEPSKVYALFEKLGYVSLIISLFSITFYAILIA